MKKLTVLILFLILMLSNFSVSQWIQQTTNVDRPYKKIYFVNQNRGWAIVNSGYMLASVGYLSISENGGNNWTNVMSGGVALSDFQFINENTGWMIGNRWTDYTPPVRYIYRTTNGGYSWQIQFMDSARFRSLYSICITGSSGIWVTGAMETMLRSTNGGANWIVVQDSISFSYNYKIVFVNNYTGFITGSHGKIYKTTNEGLNWVVKLQNPRALQDIYFRNDQTGYCSGDNGTLFKTTNGGENWNSLNSGMNNKTIYSVFFVNDSTGYYAGGDAYYGNSILCITTNSGNSWNVQVQETGNYYGSIYFVNQITGWCAGGWVQGNWGIGRIFKTTNGGISGFINQIPGAIPDEFSLHQNYPNPFNPTTKIRFDIPAPSPLERVGVRLVIYDLLGREVATLVNEELKPGIYEVEWDPEVSGRGGSGFASGVYFYSLTTKEFTQTRKSILLK